VVHDWRQDATHVVTQLPPDALTKALGTADLPPGVHVVEGDWVSECLRQNELVDDATFRIPFGVRIKQLQQHLVHDDGEGTTRPAAVSVDSDAEDEEAEEEEEEPVGEADAADAAASAASAAPATAGPRADGDEGTAAVWDDDDFRAQERAIPHPPVVDVDGAAQAAAAAALRHMDAPVLAGLPASGFASRGAEPLPPEQAKATSTSPWEHSKTAAAPWDAIRAAYDGAGGGGAAATMPPQLVALAEALQGADAIELPVAAAAGAAAATAPRASYATAAEYPRPQWSDDEEGDGDDGAPDAPTVGPDPITQQLQVRVHRPRRTRRGPRG